MSTTCKNDFRVEFTTAGIRELTDAEKKALISKFALEKMSDVAVQFKSATEITVNCPGCDKTKVEALLIQQLAASLGISESQISVTNVRRARRLLPGLMNFGFDILHTVRAEATRVEAQLKHEIADLIEELTEGLNAAMLAEIEAGRTTEAPHRRRAEMEEGLATIEDLTPKPSQTIVKVFVDAGDALVGGFSKTVDDFTAVDLSDVVEGLEFSSADLPEVHSFHDEVVEEPFLTAAPEMPSKPTETSTETPTETEMVSGFFLKMFGDYATWALLTAAAVLIIVSSVLAICIYKCTCGSPAKVEECPKDIEMQAPKLAETHLPSSSRVEYEHTSSAFKENAEQTL